MALTCGITSRLTHHVEPAVTAGAPPVAANGDGTKLRFIAKGLRSHRTRLGLSAADFGDMLDHALKAAAAGLDR